MKKKLRSPRNLIHSVKLMKKTTTRKFEVWFRRKGDPSGNRSEFSDSYAAGDRNPTTRAGWFKLVRRIRKQWPDMNYHLREIVTTVYTKEFFK